MTWTPGTRAILKSFGAPSVEVVVVREDSDGYYLVARADDPTVRTVSPAYALWCDERASDQEIV